MLRRFESYTCHVKIPNCIVCDKELASVDPKDKNLNQPYGATTFMTHGHYGSTVFDPMNPSVWLEINVCDDCLTERQSRVLHVTKLKPGFTTEYIHEPWNRYKHG